MLPTFAILVCGFFLRHRNNLDETVSLLLCYNYIVEPTRLEDATVFLIFNVLSRTHGLSKYNGNRCQGLENRKF